MSVPVSQYEALLAEVRGLRQKAYRVQQLARPLIAPQNDSALDYTMKSLLLNRQQHYEKGSSSDQDHQSSEDEFRLGVPKSRSSRSQMSVSSEPVPRAAGRVPLESMYHGAWPNVERTSMWNSEPASLGEAGTYQRRKDSDTASGCQNEVSSVMSFASSSGGVPIDRVLCSPEQKWSSQQLEAKMDVVNSLLSMLGSQEHVDMGETLLALSACQESCLAMRQSGCIPLLVQLVQSEKDRETQKKATQALHNLVNSQPDEKIRKRETRILKLLEDTSHYIEFLKFFSEDSTRSSDTLDADKHPVETVAHLMKLSFDEAHRQAICQLGGIYTVATLVEVEHFKHGSAQTEGPCVLMRRYACMALTNLTFGDSGNKTLLCSFRDFMRALILQLQSPSDELRQVTASVLRNLSWRSDSSSKEILREVGSVTGLMKAAMLANKENTLKSILSAIWNLSAHCTENKSEICAVEGGLGFIVGMLIYKTPSKSLAIIENAGGILRNISSQIAVREDYREILRKHNCLQILLDQLKSPSLSIVSNACGTLWNLSAKNSQDQDTLWQMGAPAMLRSLNHSKHKMIAMGSSAALKNLLNCRPQQNLMQHIDSTALALNLPELPTLGARKQKNLMQDLDQTLSETYDNIDKDSPVKTADLTSNFASLNLNEPSTSYNYGGSSLPYVPQPQRRTNPASFLPVRTKYPDHNYDDGTDQPIDYSQKYSESMKIKIKSESGLSFADNKEEDYIGYTETDLDQPTDYSLRYAEDDSDSDICNKMPKEYVQDTVKTYCTEGTPYETPFVFSTATSISDLRNVGTIDEKPVIDNDIQKKIEKSDNKETKIVDEKDRCSTEDISELENVQIKQKSEFSSGMMSPEKPVNYCEEGTPGYFSRVSSFGSGLDSIPANETIKKEDKPSNPEASPLKVEKHEETITTPKTPGEVKVVKFEQVVNYAEQTPLMFSRSSSLASLDSIEQHSIHDDRSSVVSDFRTSSARLTSGIVSPSDLPDSPTQTVPSSPRSKSKLDFPSTSKFVAKRPQKASVFEDNFTKFKEESTPIQFSTATSLSSLTIDEHEDTETESPSKTPETRVHQEASNPEQQEKKDNEKEKETSGSDDLNDDSDGDDDILAACISDGMQSNISIPTASSTPKLPPFKYQSTGIPMIRRSTPPRITPPRNQDEQHKGYFDDGASQISRPGSNLTKLSIPTDNKSKTGDFSDDSSNLSGDNDNILEECIQSAMPKSKKDVKAAPHQPKLPVLLPRRAIQPPMQKSNEAAKVSIDRTRQRTHDRNMHRMKEGDRRDMSLPPYLTMNDEMAKYEVEDSPCHFSLRSSLSDLTVDGSVAGLKQPNKNHPQPVKEQSNTNKKSLQPDNSDQQPRRESLSSLSSLASNEGDQLLKECIYSGMPTNRHEEALLNECIQAGMPKSSSDRESLRPFQRDDFLAQSQSHVAEGSSHGSKNVNVASVAGNTAAEVSPLANAQRPEMSNTVAGVEESRVVDWSAKNGTEKCGNNSNEPAEKLQQRDLIVDTLPVRLSHSDENFLTDQTKSGSSKSVSQFLEASFENDFTYSNSDNCVNLEDSTNLVNNRMLDPEAMIESLDRFTAELVSQASHLTKEKPHQSKLSSTDNTWNEDLSQNTFPTMSASGPNVITFESEREAAVDEVDGNNQEEGASNDFSSLNTTTMTESTLIAIEAGRMVSVLKKQAEMAQSTGAKSMDLDSTGPPSHFNSLANSIDNPKKQASRKKSLPGSLLVKRALGNHCSSLESLENSITNLELVNPPSEMDNSISSISSLPMDYRESKVTPHPIFTVKNQFISSGMTSMNGDLEYMNPPSIFNDITDMCDSLADVNTECIGTEKSVFEDCLTHIDQTLANDPTDFSDANSITPIQSDISSVENSPKKTNKPPTKSMMSKQRRNIARDRYKTYVVAAEKVMQESIELESKSKLSNSIDEASDPLSDYHTVNDQPESIEATATYTVATKVTPKERRRMDRSRFETQVVAESALKDMDGASSSSPSPTRSKLSIRRCFMQKRLENKERFRTHTLSESSFGSPESGDGNRNEIDFLMEKEANLVLKNIRDSKLFHDEMLDSETLSLVSNDDDSEHNSGGFNYRTYNKSLKTCASVPSPLSQTPVTVDTLELSIPTNLSSSEDDDSDKKPVFKPKIVKPTEKTVVEEEVHEEEVKGIRGRRKPLYSKTNLTNKVASKTIKPAKNMASALVKNITSTIKSGSALNKTPPTKPPVKSSGYGFTRQNVKKITKPPLERQGTFTKDDLKTRLPTPPSKIPSFSRPVTSKIPTNNMSPKRTNGLAKSASADRANRNSRLYNRSTSADSREPTKQMQPSSSTQSLKNEAKAANGALKKSAIPSPAQRSNSNNSIASNGSAKKNVTSKIASLWKKVEESKAKQPVQDKRIWIQSEKPTDDSANIPPSHVT